MTYLDRAIKDGYAIITGPENKQKIIYVTSDNHTENYNDPEEKVRAECSATRFLRNSDRIIEKK